MSGSAKDALAIIRAWDWTAWTDRFDEYTKPKDLCEVVNRLAFEGVPNPPSVVLELLCNGDLMARAEVEWNKCQGVNHFHLSDALETLKPFRWKQLASLVEADNDARRRNLPRLEPVDMSEFGKGKCPPYEWAFADNRILITDRSFANLPWDDAYCVEWFSAWSIEIWPPHFPEQAAAFDDDLPEEETAKSRKGRPPAQWWPDFAEELAWYIHEVGFPAGEGHDGQSDMIEAIFARMAESGKNEASRTTVQSVINALLDRFRSAGK